MYTEKKYTKTKILLFSVFIILLGTFVVQVVTLIKSSITVIGVQQDSLRCSNLVLDLDIISYKDNNLIFEVASRSYSSNISKVTVIADNSTEEFVNAISPPLEGGKSKYLITSNIIIKDKVSIFADECRTQMKELSVKG